MVIHGQVLRLLAEADLHSPEGLYRENFEPRYCDSPPRITMTEIIMQYDRGLGHRATGST